MVDKARNKIKDELKGELKDYLDQIRVTEEEQRLADENKEKYRMMFEEEAKEAAAKERASKEGDPEEDNEEGRKVRCEE